MNEKAPSVVLVVTSLNNVFVDAWLETLALAASRAAVLYVARGQVSPVPAELEGRVVTLTESTSLNAVRSEMAALLGGEAPQSIMHWWGIHSPREVVAHVLWPDAREYVCVDTFPNASRLSTEMLEVVRNQRAVSRMAGFVSTSEQMSSLVRRRFPALRAVPDVIVPSPFPLRAHSPVAELTQAKSGTICFIGRSDFIARTDRSMLKDDLAETLIALKRQGLEVFVQEPTGGEAKERLRNLGLSFYERVSRAELLNGTFARWIGTNAFNLVAYNPANATIRRRVSTGLSTRFATALTSPAHILTNDEASFAADLFRDFPIGNTLRSFFGGELSDDDLERSRSVWRDEHTRWSGEASASELGLLLSGGLARRL